MMRPSALLCCACALALPALASPQPEADNLAAFIAGDYVMAGRTPDGTAYTGQARISGDAASLKIEEIVDGKPMSMLGTIRKSETVDRLLVVFSWGTDASAMEMTCLADGDLDNYARLTCYQYAVSGAATVPSVIAYFPTAPFPDGAPGKVFPQ